MGFFCPKLAIPSGLLQVHLDPTQFSLIPSKLEQDLLNWEGQVKESLWSSTSMPVF